MGLLESSFVPPRHTGSISVNTLSDWTASLRLNRFPWSSGLTLRCRIPRQPRRARNGNEFNDLARRCRRFDPNHPQSLYQADLVELGAALARY